MLKSVSHIVDIPKAYVFPEMTIGDSGYHGWNISMQKSAITWCLDIIRYLLITSGTFAVMLFLGMRVHWLLSIMSAAPVCVAILFLCDFFMLPLYLLTPEHRSVSTVLKAIERDDFDLALRVLETHEKANAGRPGRTRNVKPTNVDGDHTKSIRAQNDDPIQNGIQKLQLSCEELIDSIEAVSGQKNSCPEDEGSPFNHNKADKEKAGTREKDLTKMKKATCKPKVDPKKDKKSMEAWDGEDMDSCSKKQADCDAKKIRRKQGAKYARKQKVEDSRRRQKKRRINNS